MSRIHRQIDYSEFVQRVRRHRPSDLLLALARVAIAMRDREQWMNGLGRVVTPWALGLAAKESIISGNQHREPGVSEADVLQICQAAANVRDPLGSDSSLGDVASFFTRTSHEQFPFQMSPFEEIARTQAIYVDALAATSLTHLSAETLASALGCAPITLAGVGWLAAVGAQMNEGYFSPGWLHQPNFGPICEVIPREVILDVFKRHFVSSAGQMRSSIRQNRVPELLRRWEFNPLQARPFMAMQDGRCLAPQPAYAFHKLYPDSIYYAVAPALGPDFTNDLGRIFQTYVGRQLREFSDAVVLDEIEYARGQRSVDFIVIWPDAVLLVEAKTTRLTAAARLGSARLSVDLDRTIGEGFEQLQQTYGLIRDRHPAFASVPLDRPVLGMIVTLEPYWMANSPLLRDLMTVPAPSIPTMVASCRDLEHVVGAWSGGGAASTLLEVYTDPERSRSNLGTALPASALKRKNRLLEEAWKHIPWSDPGEEMAA